MIWLFTTYNDWSAKRLDIGYSIRVCEGEYSNKIENVRVLQIIGPRVGQRSSSVSGCYDCRKLRTTGGMIGAVLHVLSSLSFPARRARDDVVQVEQRTRWF